MGKDGFNWFVGVVEDRDDPEHASRVRVRCLGYHSDDTGDIPTADLPWASVMMPVTAGANSGIGVSPHFLLEGTWVLGFFRDPAKQEPIILGALPGKNTTDTTEFTIASSSKEGGQSKKEGFKDPNSKYPLKLYLDLPDTNLLAQNDTTDILQGFATSTSSHVSNETKGGSIALANSNLIKWVNASGSSLEQLPSTQDQAQYPYNHVFETECGHYVEFDDTEGSERIHVWHKMGTFIEIDKDGNIVLKTPEGVNMTTIIGGNMDTYVQGDYSLSVDGTMDIYGKGDITELWDSNRKTTIGGTETLEITGAVEQTYSSTLTQKVTGAVEHTFSASLKTSITAAANIEASGNMVIKGATVAIN